MGPSVLIHDFAVRANDEAFDCYVDNLNRAREIAKKHGYINLTIKTCQGFGVSGPDVKFCYRIIIYGTME